MPVSKSPAARRGIGLRSYLLALTLASIVPLGLFAGVLLYLLSDQQQDQIERAVARNAEVLALALDNHVDSSLKRLSVLANETALRGGDLEAFAARAREALKDSPDWRSVLMTAPDGTQVVNTLVPVDKAPSGIGLPYIREALETGKPVVSGLFRGRVSKQRVVGVAVPVRVEGAVQYVLAAGLDLDFFDALLTTRAAAVGAISAVLDRDRRFIARSGGGDSVRDAAAEAPLLEALERAPRGVTRYVTQEGWQALAAWAPVPSSGWTVMVAVPLAVQEGQLLRYLAVLSGIWLFVAVGGTFAATYLARRMASTVETLARDAEGIVEGREPSAPDSAVSEFRLLGAAHERAAARLNELIQRERDDRERAEAENRSKDEFLAMLGHELRNPLGAISNAVRILEAPEADPDAARFSAGVIARQSAQLRRLIDDLLDVNRVISGKIALNREPVDLAEVTRHALNTLSAGGSGGAHAIETDLQPAWTLADAARIEQVVVNLARNAYTHTPEGGRIRVETRAAGAHVEFRIIDSGAGIESDDLAHIFELFYQAPQGLERGKGGLGIGLTLVRRLIELHGGEVSADSAGRNQGAVFSFRLPAARAPVTPAAPVVPERTTDVRRVLLIEDEADSRATLARALELRGHIVEVAVDGPQGLDRARHFAPDVAIVDVGLPGMSGYDVARALREARGADLLLIALTGYGLREDERRAHEAGFDHHMVKPADFERLAGLLDDGPGQDASSVTFAR